VTATVQAVVGSYLRRYELVEDSGAPENADKADKSSIA
jgi:hypothetical protein